MILVLIVLFIIGKFSNNNSSSSEDSLYQINQTTYAATSKENFDEMNNYIYDKDFQALKTLKFNGQMKVLLSGTEVYLVSSHFSYCIVVKRLYLKIYG